MATRQVAAGLRGRPGVGRKPPVPRQGIPRQVDVVAASYAAAEEATPIRVQATSAARTAATTVATELVQSAPGAA